MWATLHAAGFFSTFFERLSEHGRTQDEYNNVRGSPACPLPPRARLRNASSPKQR